VPPRDRLKQFVRWLAPSWSAASIAAIAAGLVEGASLGGTTAVAAAGFVVLAALPILFLLSVIFRGLWKAWRVDAIATATREEGGGMPAVAGWLVYFWLSAIALGAAVFGTTHAIAALTTFRPLVVGYLQPVLSIAIVLVLVGISRPIAHALGNASRALDRRWRAAGRTSLLTPKRVTAVLLAITVVGIAGAWVIVRARIGHLELFGAVAPPAVALVALVAAHAYQSRPVRRWLALACVPLVFVLGGIATYISASQPTLTLAVWAEGTVSGFVIDGMFDLEQIRDDVSLEVFRPVATPGSLHPDVVLVTIDTVRADRTPPYGGKAEMPFFAALAERGAVFEWAFAPSNVTRRSIPSMVTGLAPNRVRGRVKGWSLRLDPRHVLVAERLRAAGYETVGFMCCENFWGPEAGTGWSRGLERVEVDKSGFVLARRAKELLAEREKTPAASRRPLFLWMHILEPHGWAEGSTELIAAPQRDIMYERTLTASDKIVAELLGAFSQRAPEAAPIVVVTADHGEALGDHGEPYHSTDLYNSQIRVPLVIAGPGIQPGRIRETVSLTGLASTLVELAGFAPPLTDGASMAPLARGTRPANPDGGIAFAAMIADRSNPGGIHTLVAGRWKLILAGTRTELYDVHADPHELTDVAAANPAKVAELRALLDDKLHPTRPVFAE
jgi:hypothetical protein